MSPESLVGVTIEAVEFSVDPWTGGIEARVGPSEKTGKPKDADFSAAVRQIGRAHV